MLTLKALPESEEALRESFSRIERAITTAAKEGPAWGLNTYGKVVERIFESEGAAINESWSPLASYTVWEREHFEYGGHHPMLQRERFLKRSLTDPSMGAQTVFVWRWAGDQDELDSHQGGNTLSVDQRGGDATLRFGTLDDRFEFLYFGDQDPQTGKGMSGRPMVPGETHVRLVGKPLDDKMIEMIDRAQDA